MAVFSKGYYLIDHQPCTVLHPWTNSCTYNALTTFLQSFYGSSKFFLLIYLFQIAVKRDFGRKVLTQHALNFCRSCFFGGFCGGSSIAVICFVRRLLGKFTPYSLGFIPGFIGGSGIFFKAHSRREIDLTLFIALVSDLYLKVFQSEGTLSISLSKELVIFTVASTLLLYCLRSIPDSFTVMWPFTPHRLPQDLERRKRCPHKGNCLDDIRKTGRTYFCYGLVLQLLKITTFNFKKLLFKPTSFVKVFLKLKNLRLPVFAGLYVSLFKGISCLLCHYRGQDEAWQALPAGVVASLCYLIHPNLSLALLAFSNLLQIMGRKYRKKFGLPSWPWQEMTFMVCMGLLYHTRAAYPHCFPSFMFKIMDTATEGRAQIVYGLVDEHLLLRL